MFFKISTKNLPLENINTYISVYFAYGKYCGYIVGASQTIFAFEPSVSIIPIVTAWNGRPSLCVDNYF